MVYAWKTRRALPGFGLALGFTLLYLSLIVLIPLSTIFLKTATLSWSEFWSTVASSRTLAAYRLSLGAAFISALVNAGCGLLVAWVLVRYRFPGKRIIDGLVDLPFALPTAVAGVTLTTLYSTTAIALVFLLAAFVLLLAVNVLQWQRSAVAVSGKVRR
jgi:sulfate/thiosulfate transport system permease protein